MHSDKNNRELPGSWLYQFAQKHFDPTRLEKIFLPIIADLQHEYLSMPHTALKRSWVLLRSYWSFWKAIGLCSIFNSGGNIRMSQSPIFTMIWGAAAGVIVSLLSWNGNRTPGTISVYSGFTAPVLLGLLCLAVWFCTRHLQIRHFAEIWKVARRISIITGIIFGIVQIFLMFARFHSHPGPLMISVGFLVPVISVYVNGILASILVRGISALCQNTEQLKPEG
jgi:hypothetical protein